MRALSIAHAIDDGLEHLEYLPEVIVLKIDRIIFVYLSQRIDNVLQRRRL